MVLFNPVEELLNSVDRHGWATSLVCVDPADSLRLMHECEKACENGDFRSAGVGRGESLQVRTEIRGDQVLWFKPGETSPEQDIYLARLEVLRLALNQRFFLGLFDFEGHFAIYPEGAFYKPHLDRHAGTGDRIITVILYLNEHWAPGDGGELKIWTTPGDKEGAYQIIQPRMGTLVCFMAGDFWHEVMPANKTRMSVTGWFRVRP